MSSSLTSDSSASSPVGTADSSDANVTNKLVHPHMTRLKLQARQKLRSIKTSLLKEKRVAVVDQAASPLFKLPLEIREQIWKYTLDSTRYPREPHFHIYDVVYDSCTYEEQKQEDTQRRKHPTQMSLLLTCRAVYFEALRYLYQHTTFTLVLLAGRARPTSNLSRHRCLGTIKQCEALFSRMQNVILVVQPGRQPAAAKYVVRIAELLDATNYFFGVKKLRLHFNLHRACFHCPGAQERFAAIVNAFYPLRGKTEPIVIQTRTFRGSPHAGVMFEGLHAELLDSTLVEENDQVSGINCLRRGAFGDNQIAYEAELNRWEKLGSTVLFSASLVAYVGLLPLSMSWTYYAYRKRKLDKGEW